MKIKDIISEQGVWQGVKTVGKGLGQIAGGVGMGALRALDKIGGGKGTGVGTAAQQAAYKAAQKAKMAAGVKGQLPKAALAQFQNELKSMGVDLNDSKTFNSDQIEPMLTQFATQFYTSGEDKAVADYVTHHSGSIPMPTVLNPKTALDYLTRMEQIKSDAQGIVKQTGKAVPRLHPASTTPIQGISLVNDYPAIIKYNNLNYSLNNKGQWEDDHGVIPKHQWQMFLYKQADLLIPGSQELNQGFDKIMAQKPNQPAKPASSSAQTTTAEPDVGPGEKLRGEDAKPLYTVVTPSGERVTKYSDGLWIDDNGDYIGDPIDIDRLEASAEANKYTKASSIPKSEMPPVTWKTQKADEREAARKKRMGQLGVDDETV